MKLAPVAVTLLLVASCGEAPTTGQEPSRSPSVGERSASPLPATNQASAARSSEPWPTSSQASTGVYGIAISASGTQLELIAPDAKVAASVAMSQSSLATQVCGQGIGAWEQPPVSATNDKVYFRDGDTRIRMVQAPSGAADVTTVPGNAYTVSSFSVSPDDQRIAVVVEDFSSATTIGIRLYVEDLYGHGHHSDIYSTTTPKGTTGTTLVPMGWHQGRLILGVWKACAYELVFNPQAWHVVDASTAVRLASMGDGNNCIPSAWPSPAGVACFVRLGNQILVYDWTGNIASTIQSPETGATELSPSGTHLFAGIGGGDPSTDVIALDGHLVAHTPGHIGCEWIDDSDVLANDGVISYPAGSVASLPQLRCAGRFPGGL